jgi:diguanylate cyclase (GGDEF)-like protein
MQHPPAASVHFDHYFALLKGFCASVRALVVFDHERNLVWQGSTEDANLEQVLAQLKPFHDSESDGQLTELGEGLSLEIIKLENEQQVMALTLFLCHGATKNTPQPAAENEKIGLLNELLLAEFEHCRELVNKEEELDHMTYELTRRYEELNLIYEAEDQAVNIHHGRELLRQLVMNTSRFLSVDVIYLYIGDKNIAIHKFMDDIPVFQCEALFDCLREKILPLLESGHSALVINHADEARLLGIEVEMPFKIVTSPIVNADARTIGLLTIASRDIAPDFSNSDRNLLDVMAKKASKIAQSHFDPLTGLENSNSFELILRDLLKHNWGKNETHAIANVDIDRMMVVNDISGRDAGDLLIKKVGQTLASMVRARDVVARIGSDKFGILLENCDLPTARMVMKKISLAVASLDMEWKGESHEVSVSIGVAPINSQSQSVTSLLNAAETARNLSKERGRNSIHILELEDSDLMRKKDQIRWVGRIQAALRDDRFLLYGQLIKPLVADSAKPHFEILMRMQDDEGEIIEPGEFMPAAENFYLMASIDSWVINQTFFELANINRVSGPPGCQVSINLSGQSLSDPYGFGAFIENKLEQYQLDASDICFEITESAAIANIEDARLFIDQVHALGCQFSLDDFGTGLSSFAYLKNLHVDYLKIDGAFVRDIILDSVCESMVSAINQVGHAMKLKTVAEFVETEAIKQKLIDIGVDYGQGSSISKPQLFRDIHVAAARSA